MTRSPSRRGGRARSDRPRSIVAGIAVPFVLIGLLASKVASSSGRKRQRPRVDVEDVPSYRVELGDTVSEIAIRHGLPTAHVLAQNGLSWKTPIFPGQKIRLEPIPDDPAWSAVEPVVERVDEQPGLAS
jgi:hypothetical protein